MQTRPNPRHPLFFNPVQDDRLLLLPTNFLIGLGFIGAV
jgi:hypothetical protein